VIDVDCFELVSIVNCDSDWRSVIDVDCFELVSIVHYYNDWRELFLLFLFYYDVFYSEYLRYFIWY